MFGTSNGVKDLPMLALENILSSEQSDLSSDGIWSEPVVSLTKRSAHRCDRLAARTG